MTQIVAFIGEYRFLSNFWPAKIVLDGMTYPTVEHAFQAAKTLDIHQRRSIVNLITPGEAKRMGKLLTYRSDWYAVRLYVMEDLVRQKFAHNPLRILLLQTGDAQLVEGNTWRDTFWGVCNNVGENHLGRILMKVRKELAERRKGDAI